MNLSRLDAVRSRLPRALALAAALGGFVPIAATHASPGVPETSPTKADPAKPSAKPSAKPAATPAPTPAAKPPAPKSDGLDLDTLLGTRKPPAKPAAPAPGGTPPANAGGTKPADAAETPSPQTPDASRQDLDRVLSGQNIADDFEIAVRLMDDTAERVEKARDAGLETQRLQEDILTRLDRLIKQAEQNQSQQQQQSQSSSSSQDQSQNQNQRQTTQQSASTGSQSAQGVDGPPLQEGDLQPPPAAPPASWGDLPVHVREALRQGFSDRFSSLYRAATEDYYRRLAEEKRRR